MAEFDQDDFDRRLGEALACEANCCRCLMPLEGIEASPWDPEGGYPEAICAACCDQIRGDRKWDYAADIEEAIRSSRGEPN